MAQGDNFLKGVGIGIGAAVLVPVVVSALTPIVRPMVRSAFKVGVLGYEKLRETVEEMGEVVDDMVAEVREEMIEAREAEEFAGVDDEPPFQADDR